MEEGVNLHDPVASAKQLAAARAPGAAVAVPPVPAAPGSVASSYSSVTTPSSLDKPPAGQENKWEEIYGEFSSSQVEILVPKFDLQSDGKVPEPVCLKVDTWLRRAMKSSPRAVLALSYPNEAEIKMQNRYKQRSMKLR